MTTQGGEILPSASGSRANKRIGRKLGKYELITRIAIGGMAEVFLARQLGYHNFRKLVVVKAVHPHLAKEREFIDMLLDEARISALLKHPRVVDIYDLGMEDNTYFIAMEYLAGQPLTEIIKTGLRARKLDIYSTIRIMADVADGLHAAHNLKALTGEPLELVHRDVSPGNIIVLYDGNVKLVDFGISKARGRLHQTGMTKAKGKIGYAAPEQVRGERVDRRTDIFSLGVCMWETLTHKRLFAAESQRSVLDKMERGQVPPPSMYRHETPPEIDQVVLRALQIEPKARFQSAAEMQRQLEVFLRAANYYRESNAIADYMDDMFSARRREQQELIRNASEGTKETRIDKATLKRPDFGTEDGEDDGVVTSAKPPASGKSDKPRSIVETRSLLRGEDVTKLETPVAPSDDAVTPRNRPVPPPIPKHAIDDVDDDAFAEDEDIDTDVRELTDAEAQIRAQAAIDGDPDADNTDVTELPDELSDELSGEIDGVVREQHICDTTQVVEPLPLEARSSKLWIAAVVVLIGAGIAAFIAISGSDLDKASAEADDTAATASNQNPSDSSAESSAGVVASGDDSDAVDADDQALDPDTEALLDDSDEEQAELEAEREARREAEDKAKAEAEAEAAEQARAAAAAKTKAEAQAKAKAQAAAAAEKAKVEAAAKAEAEAEAKAKAEDAARKKKAARAKNEREKPKGPSKKELRAKARAAYKAGIKLYVAGNNSAAKSRFREAIKLRPGYASPHRGLGLVYERQGNKSAAVREFKKYLKLFPRAKDAPTIQKRITRLGG